LSERDSYANDERTAGSLRNRSSYIEGCDYGIAISHKLNVEDDCGNLTGCKRLNDFKNSSQKFIEEVTKIIQQENEIIAQ